MKNKLMLLGILIILLNLTSCTKEADPSFLITVSAEESELFEKVEMHHGYIRFQESNVDGNIAVSNIQLYNGAEVSLPLNTSENRIIVGNESHWPTLVEGIQADIHSITITLQGGETKSVITPITNGKQFTEFNEEFKPNGNYELNFNYDFDSSISTDSDDYLFTPVVTVSLIEL